MSGDPKATLPASVIIPSFGRPELLVETVESVLAADELPTEIVILDETEDENARLAELAGQDGSIVRYEHRPDLVGVSAARNEAIAVARERLLAFTDDDVFIAPDWLGVLVRQVSSDPNTLLTGRVMAADSETPGGFAPSCIENDQPRLYEGRVWDDVLFTGNMAFAKDVFEDLGPFDDRLGGGSPYRSAEDNDYCFRALEAGYRISYSPDAIVHHRLWRPLTAYPKVMWNYGVGQGAQLMKHASLHDRYTLHRLWKSIARRLKRAVRLRRQDRHLALGEAAYAVGSVYGSLKWLLLERLRGQ